MGTFKKAICRINSFRSALSFLLFVGSFWIRISVVHDYIQLNCSPILHCRCTHPIHAETTSLNLWQVTKVILPNISLVHSIPCQYLSQHYDPVDDAAFSSLIITLLYYQLNIVMGTFKKFLDFQLNMFENFIPIVSFTNKFSKNFRVLLNTERICSRW